MASVDRTYSAGIAVMELDGKDVAILLSAEGGDAFGEVTERPPEGARVPKHISNVGYAPIVVTVGPVMDTRLYSWVSEMLDGMTSGRSGVIALLDYNRVERSRLEWDSAIITEVAFPAVEAAAKDAASIRITLLPERTRRVPGSGATRSLPIQTKSAQRGQFQFSVSDLDDRGAKVRSVEEIVVRRRPMEHLGEERIPDGKEAVLDVADVAFTLHQPDAAPFARWFEDFVIKGQSDDSAERTATLTLIDQTAKNDLLQVVLEGVGPFRMTSQRHVAGGAALATTRIEIYCERVHLPTRDGDPPPAAPSPPSTTTPPDPVPPDAPADEIAERLKRTKVASEFANDVSPGRELGRKWAASVAHLDELTAVAALADHDDWTAMVLPEGHSLVQFLVDANVLAIAGSGVTDLGYDRFVAGLVEGAAEVYRRVAPHLDEPRKS